MLIPLKRKYRTASKGRYSGGEKPAPRKHRNKIGREAHVRLFGEPKTTYLVVEGRTGKGIFITQ